MSASKPMDTSGKHSPYRYERKFVTHNQQIGLLEQLVLSHPACFSEIFHLRQVNNIYFDTPGLLFFHDNVSGSANRTKVRIRWYGSDFQTIEHPVLEFKYKQGVVGRKSSWELPAMSLPKQPDKQFFAEFFASADLPGIIKEQLSGLEPVVMNRYQRRYFLSFDRRFRFTVDNHLQFFDIRRELAAAMPMVLARQVLELKYGKEFDQEAASIINALPMRLSKSSKYVSGLYLIRPDLAV